MIGAGWMIEDGLGGLMMGARWVEERVQGGWVNDWW